MKTKMVCCALIILNVIACSPKTDEKPTGVLTTAQEQTLQKAKQTDEALKKVEEERLKQLDQVDGKQPVPQ